MEPLAKELVIELALEEGRVVEQTPLLFSFPRIAEAWCPSNLAIFTELFLVDISVRVLCYGDCACLARRREIVPSGFTIILVSDQSRDLVLPVRRNTLGCLFSNQPDSQCSHSAFTYRFELRRLLLRSGIRVELESGCTTGL